MLRTAQGDKAAFATLFDRHQARVVRFCHRFVLNRAHAEELAQDIFVKVYRSAKRYQPSAQFKTYLFRVATNHCLNEVRRQGVVQVEAKVTDDEGPSVLDSTPADDSPHADLEAKRLEACVHDALASLSPRERAAFAMCRFEGLPYRDIAQALEATESAVKSLIHRATVQVMQHVEAMEAGLKTSVRSTA